MVFPYKVYKKCSKISKVLFKIFQVCFKRCEIPIQWRSAQEMHIPKVSNPSQNELSDFRQIALLNVEGKLFFSLVSKHLETHLINNNKFINNSIQKGYMEKIPGFWEHLSMLWHVLKEDRAQKSNLAVIWLDIANAYGSIPNKLIVFAFHRYGVSPQWIKLIETYYQGIFSKSFSQSASRLIKFLGRIIDGSISDRNSSAELTDKLLASTYDTLPSPANLKRWRITTETMCTLCNKDICATARILGACKVSLQEGRYTFRHDTVLCEVIEVLKTFILNIKDTVPISPKSSIKFVRKDTKVPHKRTPPVVILHHASGWILLADLKKTYCFPVHIAFTQLRPDIAIFSNSL